MDSRDIQVKIKHLSEKTNLRWMYDEELHCMYGFCNKIKSSISKYTLCFIKNHIKHPNGKVECASQEDMINKIIYDMEK